MGFPYLLTITIYNRLSYCGQKTVHLRTPYLMMEIDALVFSLWSERWSLKYEDLAILESKNAFCTENIEVPSCHNTTPSDLC